MRSRLALRRHYANGSVFEMLVQALKPEYLK